MSNKTQGVLVVSLDFELEWGVRDLEYAGKKRNLLPTRQVVPRLLELFRKYQIHATWATVGFLFFDSRERLLASLPDSKPQYFNQHLSPYQMISEEIGVDEQSDPLYFAPTLIRQILDTPHQELGTHTFSHYYCLEEGQTPQQFDADIQSAIRAAKDYGRSLESIVFPRNQYSSEYLEICARNGIQAYRGNEPLWFRAPSRRSEHRRLSRRFMRILDAYFNVSGSNSYEMPQAGQPLNIPASRYLRSVSKRFKILEPLRFNRILSSMREAAQDGKVFHLWWHPEDFASDVEANLAFLERILAGFSDLRSQFGMQSMTMGEVAAKARGS